MIKIGKCCCCCTLRNGAIAIGVIVFIVGIYASSSAAFGLSEEENMDVTTNIIFNITDIEVETDNEKDEDAKNGDEKDIGAKEDNWFRELRAEVTKNQATAYLVVKLIVGILEILSASSLLLGDFHFHNKQSLVVPILIVLPVILTVTWITLLAIAGFNVVIIVFILVPIALILPYFWVSLFSFWQQQRENVKQEPV